MHMVMPPLWARHTRAAFWCALAFAVSACGRDADGPLVVSAASDLARALPDIAAAFQAETGIAVSATFGASGMLAQQIMNGAPVDVFAAADRLWVDRLDSAQVTLPATRVTYARGSLAIVLAPQRTTVPRDVYELSDDSTFRRIAIANPEFAPYGRAARRALQRAGIWDRVQPRIVISENVRQALEYALSGNVDVAIVARALVPDSAHFVPVPPELHEPLYQDAIVIARSNRAAAARQFVAFLVSDSGRAILQRHRFHLIERMP